MTPSTHSQTWTVLEILNWTKEYFARSGIANPRLNAEVLLGNVLGLERIMLYARFQEPVGQPERQRFREQVRRRAAGEPLQYLVGEWEFYGRDFEVGPDVLIPRPETELLIDRCLELVPADGVQRWAADIGTGSGAIAVTLAVERPALQIIATDISPRALEVAARNAERHGVTARVRLIEGDITEPMAAQCLDERAGLDLLASNPPYVPTAEIEHLAPEVRDHEPRAALDGGPDGLDVIRRLVPAATRALAPGGWLVMELGPGQAEAVAELCERTEAFQSDTVTVASDAGGCRRVFSVRKND